MLPPHLINQAEAEITKFNQNNQNRPSFQSQEQSTVSLQQVNQTSQVAFKPEISNCPPMKPPAYF